MAIDPSAPLCQRDALQESHPVGVDSARGELIVLRLGATVRAYQNRCPHRNTTLDWVKDRFLSSDGQHLQCATHAALFRMGDGLCIYGPCAGESLQAVALIERDGAIFLDDSP